MLPARPTQSVSAWHGEPGPPSDPARPPESPEPPDEPELPEDPELLDVLVPSSPPSTMAPEDPPEPPLDDPLEPPSGDPPAVVPEPPHAADASTIKMPIPIRTSFIVVSFPKSSGARSKGKTNAPSSNRLPIPVDSASSGGAI